MANPSGLPPAKRERHTLMPHGEGLYGPPVPKSFVGITISTDQKSFSFLTAALVPGFQSKGRVSRSTIVESRLSSQMDPLEFTAILKKERSGVSKYTSTTSSLKIPGSSLFFVLARTLRLLSHSFWLLQPRLWPKMPLRHLLTPARPEKSLFT